HREDGPENVSSTTSASTSTYGIITGSVLAVLAFIAFIVLVGGYILWKRKQCIFFYKTLKYIIIFPLVWDFLEH
ncbi:hypothetical protein GOODEAATRI_034249, partial [Goodea atripinnis]